MNIEWVVLILIALFIALGFFIWGNDKMDNEDDYINHFKGDDDEH